MVLVNTIEQLTNWVKENICSEIKLLMPYEKGGAEGYRETYINPPAFPLYIPANDCLPPGIVAKHPCVCVQLLEGSDDLRNSEETLKIRLAFAIWRPGRYVKDADGMEELEMNLDGWKDVWQFVGKAKRILQKAMYIEGVRIDRKTPMKFGFFGNEETALVNAYPEWYAWLTFSVVSGIEGMPADNYQEYL